MTLFKWLFVTFFLNNFALADDVTVVVEELKNSQLSTLEKKFPGDLPENFRSVNITYSDYSNSQFIRVGDIPTLVKYSQLLNCGDTEYPTVMLQTDGSFEKASLSVTLIKNRLYIFDKSLNLIKSFESTYHSEEDDDGLYVEREHVFTLDNVEKYACDYIKTLR